MGRAINFIMRVGSDIKTALRDTEIKKAIKSNIFGVGFEHGSRTSIGCSYNGRIWSMRNNNILTWTRWCQSIAAKITDPLIDPDLVLKGTLIPKEISQIPDTLLFSIEWPDIIFRQSIGNFELTIANEVYPIWNCEISLDSQTKNSVFFSVSLPSGVHRFELKLSTLASDGYTFEVISASEMYINVPEKVLLADFLTAHPPLMYFIDGSFLEGNFYTEIKEVIPSFSMDLFDLHDWDGINIKKESQTAFKYTDSIQHSIIQRLIALNKYDVIMDDDDKGEIGDIVAFQVFEKERILLIDVFHCKYSSEINPGHRVKDFYEVCGQAQKNVKWMEEIDEIFKHLSRRSADRLRNQGVDRFEKGNQDQLDILRRRAKKDLKVRMNVCIVQPGLSFGDYDENGDVSKLLAVVQTYLKETWNAELRVIASE
ncbi:MAG: hypothetical protein IBJ16_08785 [Chitinophagaceae bacterium]|nr:hypothetical protein [Chitinophagaceae bacterium]